MGVPVIYADELARELSNTDADVTRSIRELLGDRAYTSDGVLDRAFVASKVFSNRGLRKKLNAIIHPRVERAIVRAVKELEQAGKRTVIVEAALIYEAGLDQQLDAVVVVDAGEEQRVTRVVGRDGVGRESVLARMNAQQDPAISVKKADYVIRNDGTVNDLEQRVVFLHSIFQHLSENNS